MDTKEIKIYCDGGARGNPGPAASAFVIIAETGRVVAKKGVFIGISTNNQAEYRAVIEAFDWILGEHLTPNNKIFFYLDSELVVNQLNGVFKVKDKKLKNLWSQVQQKENKVKNKIHYRLIEREKNKLADFIVNQTLDKLI